LWLEAIEAQENVIATLPDAEQLRVLLRYSCDALARVQIRLGDAPAAAATIERLVAIEPPAGITQFSVAELIGHLLTFADANGADVKREKLIALAIDQLRGAKSHEGATDALIEQSRALAPLRDRDDFQELLQGEDRSGGIQ
jgi:hypothetical protein